ncbi:MAG: ATP-dependent zinc metalloprotease FtsH [Thermoleophilaceae bacterium]|nr:ATP-dependent zinc metalloprotease FtsH [Thermoleophilaceae bacterium]
MSGHDVVRAFGVGALLLALLALLVPARPAAAQSPAATCEAPLELTRDGRAAALPLEQGIYTISLADSSRLSCDEAREQLRGFLSDGAAPLPGPWTVDRATATFTRGETGAPNKAAFTVRPQVPAAGAAADESFFDGLENFAVIWLPVIFMGLIAVVLILTLRHMPRTKPQEITPQSSESIGWDDVAGVEEAKDELREVVEFLRDPERFRALGAKVPKGILLHGPPGTGKTLLAKAVAHESNAKFFAQSASSFVEMFAGLGAARIRRLFRMARKQAPAIVFIDELDAVGATRGNDISGEKDQTLNQLLVELDGFGGGDNLVVIAASNLIDKLDPALLRPGRFDRQIFVTPPDLKGRKQVLTVHTDNKPLAEDVDLELVARQTSGLTGADLANICNEAAIFAGRDHRDHILTRDFESALERVVAGMQSRRVITDHEKRVVAYHEAGHALCSELLPSVEKVHRISIVPRGQALGYTLNLPEEDRYLKTKEELMDYLVVLLGGRVTEHQIFGQITTGASDDLKKVHEISRAMIVDYGMGTNLQSKQLPATDYSMSDATRRMIDEEQQFIADQAHRRAQQMVAAHLPLLEHFARTLLENEVLERGDIERLVAEHEGAQPAARRLEPLLNGSGHANGSSSGPRVAASKRLEPGAS